MNHILRSTILAVLLLTTSKALADKIPCQAQGASTAFQSSIGTTGLYGLCMVETCNAGLDLYKNKCFAPGAPVWSLSSRTVERGDYSIVAYAILPRPLSDKNPTTYSVVPSGAIPNVDYVLPSTDVIFDVGQTISHPFEIQLSQPGVDIPQRDLRLTLSGGSVATITLQEINKSKPVLSLSFQNSGTGAVVSEVIPATNVALVASLDKVASKYFSTRVRVNLTKAAAGSASQIIDLVIPKNEKTASYSFVASESILSATASPYKNYVILSGGGPLNVAATYHLEFGLYDPQSPATSAICGGTQTASRTMTCKRNDGVTVAASFCGADPAPTTTYFSPPGDVTTAIDNGSETRHCAAGASVQTFVARSCAAAYYDTGSACSAIAYVASFSEYSTPQPSWSQPCSGSETVSRSMTCKRVDNQALVSNDLCPVDPAPTKVVKSDAGPITVPIAGGSEVYTCDVGSTVRTFVSRSCDSGYYETNACTPVQATAPPTTEIYASSSSTVVLPNGFSVKSTLGEPLIPEVTPNNYKIYQIAN
jgi:hypothetical protein